MRRLTAVFVFSLAAISLVAASQDVPLPGVPASLKFAVIGDNGTGATTQYEVGTQMASARGQFPFELVIMLGDNLYGRQQPQDYVNKVERPYASMLQAGVPFYAALGNHDDQDQRFYKAFNMGGERYYTFARKNVRFFVFIGPVLAEVKLGGLASVVAALITICAAALLGVGRFARQGHAVRGKVCRTV